jgi:hypothetical protein
MLEKLTIDMVPKAVVRGQSLTPDLINQLVTTVQEDTSRVYAMRARFTTEDRPEGPRYVFNFGPTELSYGIDRHQHLARLTITELRLDTAATGSFVREIRNSHELLYDKELQAILETGEGIVTGKDALTPFHVRVTTAVERAYKLVTLHPDK